MITVLKKLILIISIISFYPKTVFAETKVFPDTDFGKQPYFEKPSYCTYPKNIFLLGNPKVASFLALQAAVLPFIIDEPAVTYTGGIFKNPSFKGYWDNMKNIRLHDGDELKTEIYHVAAGGAMWAYFRSHGYSRQETFWAILGTGLWREWVWKGWGTAQSLDDPLIFAGSGLALGYLSEELFGIDYGKFHKTIPILNIGSYGDEYFVFAGIRSYIDF